MRAKLIIVGPASLLLVLALCFAQVSAGAPDFGETSPAIPSDDEERDITRLAVDYRDAFDSDLARFAKFGAASFAAAPHAP